MAAPIKKSAGGRPEKYTQEWLIEEAKALREWIVQPRSLWLKGFAYERGYRPACLSEFSDKSKEFSEALEFAKDEQERKFVHGAWSKEMDMAFVKHFMPRMLKDRPEWKTSWDTPIDSEALKQAVETAVMNYATAKPEGEGWQKPETK